MTGIDTNADIDLVWHDQELTVRIPLAREVSEEWARRYPRLAKRKGVPARAENTPGRAWIVLTLPAGAGRSEALAELEAARELIAQADAAGESSPEHDQELAAAIREWWAQRRD